MARVYMGVGHGLTDPGAVANGLKESELALDVATAATNELIRHGVNVKQSRSSQTTGTMAINDKAKESDAFGADLCLDIHFNAGGGDGVEVIHSIVRGTSEVLAQNINAAVIAIGQNSRGLKTRRNDQGRDYFGMIRQPKAPAVIVECAFIDNSTDMQIADTLAERQAIGVAIAKGVLKTLGIAEIVAAPVQQPTPQAAPQATKSIDDVAREVINKLWGTGADRRNRLASAGYDADKVQARVNELLGVKPTLEPLTPPTKKITVGGKVMITGTHYATGESIPAYVKNKTYTVQQLKTTTALLKEIMSWVKLSDLKPL